MELQAARDLYYAHCHVMEERDAFAGASFLRRAWELVAVPRLRRATMANAWIVISQQFSGINIMAFYSSTIFSEAGCSILSSLLASLGFGVVLFVFDFPAVYTMDTYGRRNLLLVTFPNMAWCLLAADMGPLPSIYFSESFPLSHRELGAGMTICVNNAAGSALSLTFLSLLEKLTPTGAFAFCAGLNVLAFLVIFLIVPETKYVPLQSGQAKVARHTLHILHILKPSLRTYAADSTPEPFTARTRESPAPPRWSQTPAGMKAPMQLNFAKSFKNKIWKVNNNPGKLDDMYNRLLGPGGSKMLPEELKWLAVTHKSFDQGRRGFNDKLALMGRLTLVMEGTKEIVSKSPLPGSRRADEFGRVPFEHEQLASVDNLNVEGPKDYVGKERLYSLAMDAGMLDVLRWKPRLPGNLESSGVEVVVNGAVLAIVGAITLQHGSVVASTVVRERILARLPRKE
ncbi:hypothetical protein ED733_000111 [Metarhizium rileyi]|uniref:RNase III domain-containing protein n=1 Tax=Metarhizium rileyi (strain RCEF 4871) TaxID=1649241 RepID=A0A5C6G402_METRR|nr:hypothetical protein ED733_000111 [Metarhizium rileyi]